MTRIFAVSEPHRPIDPTRFIVLPQVQNLLRLTNSSLLRFQQIDHRPTWTLNPPRIVCRCCCSYLAVARAGW